ncbi:MULTISPECIES: M24 family metallopeptidase [Natrialbaceae]|uniref:M24 family metallopeptidase n=1 Tax=Natrialbaceae TaxID=1644061 RepID=UPI00207C95D7|nr:M24 family metallopeptidase [Natronococcus sp. CG52]
MTGGGTHHLEDALAGVLERRSATAFVHAGAVRDPTIHYCRPALDSDYLAIAFDGREWHVCSADAVSTHPADALAERLTDGGLAGTLLTPARIPHDAALYLEKAEFSLASSDVVARTRATKTDSERERIETAQAAASAGVRRAASMLTNATVVDGRLTVDGERLTDSRLRTAVDEAVVSAGALPAGNTAVSTATADAIRPDDSIVLEVAPREPGGYHGGLVRTFVVDGDGGRERRAHIGVTRALRSAAALLTADPQSVTAVEADLEAEVRAFGFDDDDGIETRVAGVGLEPHERPSRGSHEVTSGTVVRLDAGVRLDDGRVHVADLLEIGPDGVNWPEAPSRSLDPSNTLE